MRLACFLLLLIVAAAAAGCGGSAPEETRAPASNATPAGEGSDAAAVALLVRLAQQAGEDGGGLDDWVVSIRGADPPEAVLEALQVAGLQARPISALPGGAEQAPPEGTGRLAIDLLEPQAGGGFRAECSYFLGNVGASGFEATLESGAEGWSFATWERRWIS